MVTNNVGGSSYRERYNPYVSYINFSQAEQIKEGPKVVSKAKKQEKALTATGITIAALIAAIVLLRKGKVKEAAEAIKRPAKTAGNVTGKTTGIFQKIKDFFARINPFNKKASRSSVVKPQVAPADSKYFKRNANKSLKDIEKQRHLARKADLEEAFRNYTPPAPSSVQSKVPPVAQATSTAPSVVKPAASETYARRTNRNIQRREQRISEKGHRQRAAELADAFGGKETTTGISSQRPHFEQLYENSQKEAAEGRKALQERLAQYKASKTVPPVANTVAPAATTVNNINPKVNPPQLGGIPSAAEDQFWLEFGGNANNISRSIIKPSTYQGKIRPLPQIFQEAKARGIKLSPPTDSINMSQYEIVEHYNKVFAEAISGK